MIELSTKDDEWLLIHISLFFPNLDWLYIISAAPC